MTETSMKIKVGIFFGGPSREREISFAGGRTVYDNLNKSIFEPIPIFVDSHLNYIILDWSYIYKGTIRDFYPPSDFLPESPNGFQVYMESLAGINEETQDELIAAVGRKILPEDLPSEINLAFLALHGIFGEDGQIQQQLEDLSIPYTGSGVKASQIGMDKALQKELMSAKGFSTPNIIALSREEWLEGEKRPYYDKAIEEIGFPIVIRPANQGSSIGVSIIDQAEGVEGFERAVNNAFFIEKIPIREWNDRNSFEKKEYIRFLGDIRDGLGFPMEVSDGSRTETVYHPEKLYQWLESSSKDAQNEETVFTLTSHLDEKKVILESFIHGKEFSCVVIRREDDVAVALPPTEIIKGSAFFDYRSKYMPGFSRKETPIQLPDEQIEKIRSTCESLFTTLGFQTYARIDGFMTSDQEVFLNDPNTTSGMLPSSFFFHQAAEIGLNPSQFLTFIIRISLQERYKAQPQKKTYLGLMNHLDGLIQAQKAGAGHKKKIAVLLGGYSFERHISVESGRNIYEKLASSDQYEPIPVFLTGRPGRIEMYQIPVNLLLKDNADDIRDKVHQFKRHPIIQVIKQQCEAITGKYTDQHVVFEPVERTYDDLKRLVDGVFIALHGRPGEDGEVQTQLEERNIPFNGSGVQSSSITINKYQTLQNLERNGFKVAKQLLGFRSEFQDDASGFFKKIEQQFDYPFVAKPVDDGCSSAVRIIHNRDELEAYATLIFQKDFEGEREIRKFLKIKPQEEFPTKSEILFEERITAAGAPKFMEITGGLLTHQEPDGRIRYEIFEPSEALSSDEVLSLEEKFLAGEGQNITPARFDKSQSGYELVASQVKADLEKAARILDVKGYARIDAFVRIYSSNKVETIIIEVNSLPGMTPATAIFHQAAINGYKPYDFIHKILNFAFAQNASAVTHESNSSEPTSTYVSVDTLLNPGGAKSPLEVEEPAQPIINTSSDQSAIPPMKNSPGYFFSSLASFFRSSIFLKNCLGVLFFLLLLFILLKKSLDWYTMHGQTIEVKNFVNMHLDDARDLARRSDLRLVVNDSVFMLEKEPNIIIDQTPKKNARVKENRQVYVSITSSTAPMVPLPGLVGNYDYEQYTRKLERLGVKYRIKEKQVDRRYEENTILYIVYEGEKITDNKLRRGVKVPKGSTLEFVITERSNGRVEIPDLICKRYKAAAFMISSRELEIGDIYGPVSDEAYVYKQEPEYAPGATLRVGNKMNLYLMEQRPIGCPEQIEPSDLAVDTTTIN